MITFAALASAVAVGPAVAQSTPTLPAIPTQPSRTAGSSPDVDLSAAQRAAAIAASRSREEPAVARRSGTGVVGPSEVGADAVVGPAKRGRAYDVKRSTDLAVRRRD